MKQLKREDVAWLSAFIYIAYIYLGQIPHLKQATVFSTLFVSVLLVLEYALASTVILGIRRASIFFVISALIGYLMELLSIHTGYPFGSYTYTNALGPEIGPIPIFIPLLWSSLSFFSMEAFGPLWMPLSMLFLDLSFDPRFSGVLWIWSVPTQYYGDPISNFIGWFVTSAIISMAVALIIKFKGYGSLKAILFYLLFGLDSSISDIYHALYVPAAVASVLIIFLSAAFIIGNRSKRSSGSNADQAGAQ